MPFPLSETFFFFSLASSFFLRVTLSVPFLLGRDFPFSSRLQAGYSPLPILFSALYCVCYPLFPLPISKVRILRKIRTPLFSIALSNKSLPSTAKPYFSFFFRNRASMRLSRNLLCDLAGAHLARQAVVVCGCAPRKGFPLFSTPASTNPFLLPLRGRTTIRLEYSPLIPSFLIRFFPRRRPSFIHD